MKKVWKELRFNSYDDYQGMVSVLHKQEDVEAGAIWAFEGGPMILVTNLSGRSLRRLSRLDDIRLPEYVRLPDDDETVLDLLDRREKP